jgi:hypothetical protein
MRWHLNRIKLFERYRVAILVLAVVICLLPACATHSAAIQQHGLLERFSDAVRDAEFVEPGEISKDLVAVNETNDKIKWKDTPDGKRLLVVTWTAWNGYDTNKGTTMINKQLGGTWVTVVPELKEFCIKHKLSQLNMEIRLKQLLGLPPTADKTRFVEIWVDPRDLFRPSPDPEITDHEAELDFTLSDKFLTVSEDYKKWFHEKMSSSYGENGYPWTRLGYTYDWGNPDSEIGLSEFVIREGATIEIHSVRMTWEYCQ